MPFIISNFIDEYKKCTDFSGKATRKQYFYYMLAAMLVSMALTTFAPYLMGLYGLLSFLPGLAILVRRFRDADVTPWAILLILPIYVVVFLKSK